MANRLSCVLILLSVFIISANTASTSEKIQSGNVSNDDEEIPYEDEEACNKEDGPPILQERGYNSPPGIGRHFDGYRKRGSPRPHTRSPIRKRMSTKEYRDKKGVRREAKRRQIRKSPTHVSSGLNNLTSGPGLGGIVVDGVTGDTEINVQRISFNHNGVIVRLLSTNGHKGISLKNDQAFVNGKIVCSDTTALKSKPTYQKTSDGTYWHTNMHLGEPMTPKEIKKFEDAWKVDPPPVSVMPGFSSVYGNAHSIYAATVPPSYHAESDYERIKSQESDKWAKYTEDTLRGWEKWAKARGLW